MTDDEPDATTATGLPDEETAFVTAADLRRGEQEKETGTEREPESEKETGMVTGTEPEKETELERAFAIPRHPRRQYPADGGVEYEGETVFTLAPDPPDGDAALVALVERVLTTDPYTYGDWFDLPMPLYLVHDHETGDTFRVAVRDGTVELHVLPATESAGLRALHDRLCAAADCRWRVECRTA